MRPIPDDDRFPSRKNPRLKDFDYSLPYYYFITVCTWDKECIFGTAKELSPWGKIAKACIDEIERHFPGVRVDKSVVMPNHVHMILALRGENPGFPYIVAAYKAAVTRMIHKTGPHRKVWQASFHDHVIRNRADYERIWLYIDANPQNWEKDCFFEAHE
jgi:REP element-mobilizing transposase RayT